MSEDARYAAEQYLFWKCKLEECPSVGGINSTVKENDIVKHLAHYRNLYSRLTGNDVENVDSQLFSPSGTYKTLSSSDTPLSGIQVSANIDQKNIPSSTTLLTSSDLGNGLGSPRTEPILCDEQIRVVELATKGHNIFCTGSAGCGKSTVLRGLRRRLEAMGKRVHVIAPTGKAALSINGTTLWTFAGWTPDHHKRGLDFLKGQALLTSICRRFRETDVIIIDEISMVENLHLERLNAILKSARLCHEPFGGVQVIVTGDFCQLPPVKPFKHCLYCGSELKARRREKDIIYTCPTCLRTWHDTEKWAFKSHSWKEANFVHIHLKKTHRQRDPHFISMLQKCRLGVQFTPEEVDILLNHPSMTENAVKLFSTREEVRRTNEKEFARLKTPTHGYRCYDRFLWHRELHPELAERNEKNPDGSLRALNDHRFEAYLELKEGMQVVLLVNLDLDAGLYNGSQGVIIGWEQYHPDKLPSRGDLRDSDYHVFPRFGSYRDIKKAHIQQFAKSQNQHELNGILCWPIVRFHNGITQTIYPECHIHDLGDRPPYSHLCRTQIPLAPAWALSIHKSQGMTLERVVVDISRVFEAGQVYVALSRATCLEGLRIEGDPHKLTVWNKGDEEVRKFLKEKFGI